MGLDQKCQNRKKCEYTEKSHLFMPPALVLVRFHDAHPALRASLLALASFSKNRPIQPFRFTFRLKCSETSFIFILYR